MPLTRSLLRIIKNALATRGFAVHRLGDAKNQPVFQAALERLAAWAVEVASVIDVGASDGSWSEALMRIYPQAAYLLIEANAVHKAALSRFCDAHPNASHLIAAAGESSGVLYFDGSHAFSGQASTAPTTAASTEVDCVSIDDQVAQRGLQGPFLIKLDTHGFELPILRGARQTLKHASVVILECYNFKIAPQALRFHEICAHMEEMGYRCIDLFDPLYRPRDHAFWQCDLVFMRADRPEFDHATYR